MFAESDTFALDNAFIVPYNRYRPSPLCAAQHTFGPRIPFDVDKTRSLSSNGTIIHAYAHKVLQGLQVYIVLMELENFEDPKVFTYIHSVFYIKSTKCVKVLHTVRRLSKTIPDYSPLPIIYTVAV